MNIANVARISRAGLALAAALALSACDSWPMVLHPIVSEKEQAPATELLGEWQIPEESDALRFERRGRLVEFRPASPNEDATESEEEIKAIYDYRALRVGRYWVLDLTSAQSSRDESFAVPVRLLMRIELFGDSIDVRFLSGKWVTEELEKGRLDLPHEKLEDGSLLITASTKELQKFLSYNAWDDLAFPQADAKYERRPSVPGK